MISDLTTNLELSIDEREAVISLVNNLRLNHAHTIRKVLLYGSSARGGRGPESDVDLLVITENDNWREHEPIRFLAARVAMQFDIFLSVRVMSQKRFNRLQNIQPLLYQNIRRDGVELL